MMYYSSDSFIYNKIQNILMKSLWFIIITLIILQPLAAFAQEASAPSVSIVVSLNIRPYVEAVEGISRVFDEAGVEYEVYFLEKFEGGSEKKLKEKIKTADLLIGAGPEATYFLNSEFQDQKDKILYSMVLNPEKIVETPGRLCGISLTIPILLQIQKIIQIFPDVKRIGLAFDEKNNSIFFNRAFELAAKSGVEIIPLKISSRKEIPIVLEKFWGKIDGLWLIPDRTVISESIVSYIIKETLLQKIPLIGYNRFFYESGAAMSFVFDYKSLGHQTGKLAVDILSGDLCKDNVPEFQVWLNHKVLKRLEMNYIDNEFKSIIK